MEFEKSKSYQPGTWPSDQQAELWLARLLLDAEERERQLAEEQELFGREEDEPSLVG